jgi:D-alanyl-D-alanine carboxypeptidase/D-alanyl-D-alanine-endopeptidase (penicillin-binding protein 4)
LVLENGAGLSRIERISASHLAALLRDAYHSPVMAELIASLPIYGIDGSLSKRKDGALYGRAHLKTGSLENVRSIAGYLLDAKGRYWSVVFIANGLNAEATKQAQDALLNWVYLQE